MHGLFYNTQSQIRSRLSLTRFKEVDQDSAHFAMTLETPSNKRSYGCLRNPCETARSLFEALTSAEMALTYIKMDDGPLILDALGW